MNMDRIHYFLKTLNNADFILKSKKYTRTVIMQIIAALFVVVAASFVLFLLFLSIFFRIFFGLSSFELLAIQLLSLLSSAFCAV